MSSEARIEAVPPVLIDIQTDQGVTGHSYVFAYAPEPTYQPFDAAVKTAN